MFVHQYYFFLQKMEFKRQLTLYRKECYITLMCHTFANVQPGDEARKGVFLYLRSKFGKQCLPLTAPYTLFRIAVGLNARFHHKY